MPTRPVRVAVWSTGGIGTIAIRAIQRRPDLDLVGVWVHSPDKVGQQGELAATDPIGLAATDDVDAILGTGVDCVVYAAQGPEQDAASVPDYVRLLSAGVNVSTTSSWALLHPATYEPSWRAQLEATATEGGASLYATGIEPGFAADQLPLLLTTMSSSITSIRASEIAMYDTYPVEFMMKEVMGFGKPMDDENGMLGLPGSILSAWSPGINLIADALGAKLDGIREEFGRAATPRTLEVACGTLEAGTVGAIRTQAIGVVGGRDAIVIEHVNRMAADLAPDWPTASRDGMYRITIEGDPDIVCEMAAGDPEHSSPGAMVATAMRAVNAVPYLVDAEPGLRTALDLPITTPKGVFA